jgi:hypothetical protein
VRKRFGKDVGVDEAEQTVRRILTADASVYLSWSSRAALVEFLELLTAVTKGAISGLATNPDTNDAIGSTA